MKKTIIGLFFSLFVLSANADHKETVGELYQLELPALCGTPQDIQTYIDHYNLKPFHLSLGRTGMVEDGEPVYMLTYMINKETGHTIAVLDIPSNLERCILFHTFDLITELPNQG
jgi:hypothetical protein